MNLNEISSSLICQYQNLCGKAHIDENPSEHEISGEFEICDLSIKIHATMKRSITKSYKLDYGYRYRLHDSIKISVNSTDQKVIDAVKNHFIDNFKTIKETGNSPDKLEIVINDESVIRPFNEIDSLLQAQYQTFRDEASDPSKTKICSKNYLVLSPSPRSKISELSVVIGQANLTLGDNKPIEIETFKIMISPENFDIKNKIEHQFSILFHANSSTSKILSINGEQFKLHVDC